MKLWHTPKASGALHIERKHDSHWVYTFPQAGKQRRGVSGWISTLNFIYWTLNIRSGRT